MAQKFDRGIILAAPTAEECNKWMDRLSAVIEMQRRQHAASGSNHILSNRVPTEVVSGMGGMGGEGVATNEMRRDGEGATQGGGAGRPPNDGNSDGGGNGDGSGSSNRRWNSDDPRNSLQAQDRRATGLPLHITGGFEGGLKGGLKGGLGGGAGGGAGDGAAGGRRSGRGNRHRGQGGGGGEIEDIDVINGIKQLEVSLRRQGLGGGSSYGTHTTTGRLQKGGMMGRKKGGTNVDGRDPISHRIDRVGSMQSDCDSENHYSDWDSPTPPGTPPTSRPTSLLNMHSMHNVHSMGDLGDSEQLQHGLQSRDLSHIDEYCSQSI